MQNRQCAGGSMLGASLRDGKVSKRRCPRRETRRGARRKQDGTKARTYASLKTPYQEFRHRLATVFGGASERSTCPAAGLRTAENDGGWVLDAACLGPRYPEAKTSKDGWDGYKPADTTRPQESSD